MRAEKEEGGVGPSQAGTKTERTRAHESRERRGWESPRYAGTQTLQTRDAWDAIDGWFQFNDSSCWPPGHRYHPTTCTSEKEGRVPVKRGPKQKDRAHESRERKGWGGSQLSRDQNKKKESTWEQRKKGLGESLLSRDSNIVYKGHMRCNRWVISMQT